MTCTLYGIKSCDTVRRARHWLDTHHIVVGFHDFRRDGLEPSVLNAWIECLGYESIINNRSTTWRQLAPELRNNLDADHAAKLMLDNPTLIKRPILDCENWLLVGFDEEAYINLIKKLNGSSHVKNS